MEDVKSYFASNKGGSLEWAKAVLRSRSEKDYAQAYSVISDAATEGSGDGRFCLGLMYARGQGVNRDLAAAVMGITTLRNRVSRKDSMGNRHRFLMTAVLGS